MSLGLEGIPGGPFGALGAVAASSIAGFLFIRKAIRGDKVDSAATKAEIDILARLSEELTKANNRADLAENRAGEAYKELNLVTREMGELKAILEGLKVEIRMLKERISTDPSDLAQIRQASFPSLG